MEKRLFLAAAFLLLLGCAYAGSVTRSFSSATVQPGADLTVTLTASVIAGETYYAIDESTPSGWAVKDAGTAATGHAGHLKWVVYENPVNTTYNYVLTAPSQNGTAAFSGVYMFEGMGTETQIVGQAQLIVQTVATCGNGSVDAGETCANCPADAGCSSGTICCNDSCIASACSADSQCADADACTADSCIAPGTCSASCTHTAISGCGSTPPAGPVGPGGGEGPGGGGGPKLLVTVQGGCVGLPTSVIVLNESGNPSSGAVITVVKDRKTTASGETGFDGKAVFTLQEPGAYTFYVTKSNYLASSHVIALSPCGSSTVQFSPEIETGKIQTIFLIAGDGTPILDFTVSLKYPDDSTILVQAVQGSVVLLIEKTGKYTAEVQAKDFEQTVNFEARAPMQVVPPIKPGAQAAVTAVFGEETVETPNYLIIWILAIAIISGLIIEVTKLKPGWFRVFMATTYTTLPLIVNYYTGNIWISFAVIAIQTVILTALYFSQWKAKRAIKAAEQIEWQKSQNL